MAKQDEARTEAARVRMTKAEFRDLGRLVVHLEAKARIELVDPTFTLTQSDVLRRLVAREVVACGLDARDSSTDSVLPDREEP